MFKTATTIIITTVVVLFSIQNFEHVPVNFFFGKPIHIRLIFVMVTSGIVGYLIRHFSAIGKEEKLKRQLHYLLKTRQRRMKPVAADFDAEFDEDLS